MTKRKRPPISHANRGKVFENMIQKTNEVYQLRGIALISKNEPEAVIIRRGKRIINVFFRDKSISDYSGISHGTSIAFEAKSTNERTRFDLSNIKDHQVKYLQQHEDQGGKSFYLIYFKKFNETYLIWHKDLYDQWWVPASDGGRKSIPYEYFKLEAEPVKSRKGVLLDYMKVVRDHAN